MDVFVVPSAILFLMPPPLPPMCQEYRIGTICESYDEPIFLDNPFFMPYPNYNFWPCPLIEGEIDILKTCIFQMMKYKQKSLFSVK